MKQERRYALLKERVSADYNGLLQTADFSPEHREKQADVIAMAKAVRHYMETGLSECPMDVEALLFYDNPLMSVCDRFTENSTSLWNGLAEPFNDFIQDTKRHIRELYQQWESLPSSEAAKAHVYLAMEARMVNSQPDGIPETLGREDYGLIYHTNVVLDYAQWNEYLVHYFELHSKPNEKLETTLNALYARMLSFDGLTTEQLQAMAGLDEPLTAVHRCFTVMVQGDPQNEKELDAAILGVARAQTAIMHHEQSRRELEHEEQER